MKKKITFKSKKTWKNILCIGLAVITFVGAIFGISALFKKSEETTKKVSPSWAIGGLTETGAYLETKESIYTKDLFECKGLNVKMDFDNNISYRIFFYDYNDEFVSATEKLTTNYSEDIDLFVKSARIVITPNEDGKISWYEKSGYAKQLTISVDKEQPDDIFKNIKSHKLDVKLIGSAIYNTSTKSFDKDSSSPFYFFDVIDVSNTSCIVVKVKTSSLGKSVSFSSVSFDVPLMYDCSNGNMLTDLGYSVLAVDGDFSYVVYNVASLNSVCFAFDVTTVDFVEFYI